MKFSISLKNLSFEFPIKKSKDVTNPLSVKTLLLAIFVLSVIGIGAWAFYYSQDLTLAYNDARSHLNVSRRVVDSLQPGIAQIGSVWLPLYHVLEIPLVWNDFLWQSGISGSIVSVLAYIFGGFYLLKLVERLDFSRLAILVSFLVYAFNPNLVFMQTTPMTESLLLSLAIASIYYMVAWTKDEKTVDLIKSAGFIFLGTLTRYDAWFLLMFAFFYVMIASYFKKGYKYAEGNTILFGSLAGLGVVLWFLWNLLIFKDPFYFAFGPFSAKSQQDVLSSEGRLLTKGNFLYSFFVYSLTSLYNIGHWITFLSIFGFALMMRANEYSKYIKWAVMLVLVPFVFNVLSLVAGHSVIHIPAIPPYTWFNDRYGLMMLPAAAVFTGYVVNKRNIAAILAVVVVFLQFMTMTLSNNIITIEDGVRGASGDFLDSSSAWIQKNYDEGKILVAASSNDALLFKAGLHLDQYITEGASKYWWAALDDPTPLANYIIMHRGDLVYEALSDNENFLYNYKLVYKDSFSYVYKREINTPLPIDESTLPR